MGKALRLGEIGKINSYFHFLGYNFLECSGIVIECLDPISTGGGCFLRPAK